MTSVAFDRPRNAKATALCRLVEDNFDELERV
jgi:hypothetical protein